MSLKDKIPAEEYPKSRRNIEQLRVWLQTNFDVLTRGNLGVGRLRNIIENMAGYANIFQAFAAVPGLREFAQGQHRDARTRDTEYLQIATFTDAIRDAAIADSRVEKLVNGNLQIGFEMTTDGVLVAERSTPSAVEISERINDLIQFLDANFTK